MNLNELKYEDYHFNVSKEDVKKLYEMNKKLEKNKKYMKKLKKFIKDEKIR